LTITPFGSEGQKYPDIEIIIIHEDDFNYKQVVFLLEIELYKLNLEFIERSPIFRANNGTDTDVMQGGEFEREAKYSVKVKFLDDEEKLSEENSKSDKKKHEQISTNSLQNQDKFQSMDSVRTEYDQFFMNSVHDKNVLSHFSTINDHSISSCQSFDLPQHLSNINDLYNYPDTYQLNKFKEWKLEKSEAYFGSQEEGLYEEYENKHEPHDESQDEGYYEEHEQKHYESM